MYWKEVSHLQIALVVDEKILWLKVAVNEVQVMEVLKRQHDLSRVETGMRFAEITRKHYDCDEFHVILQPTPLESANIATNEAMQLQLCVHYLNSSEQQGVSQSPEQKPIYNANARCSLCA